MEEKDIKQEEVEEKVVEETPEDADKKLHESEEFQAAVNNTAVTMKDLLQTQKIVNDKVQEKLGDKTPGMADYILAYNVELYELINEIGVWKWWKQHNQPNKDRVLDELADCFAFMLSSMSLINEDKLDEVLAKFAFIYWDFKVHMDPAGGVEQTKNIITNIGVSSEVDNNMKISTVQSFALIILAVEFLFNFEVDWDDFVYYYKRKSKVNIKRQEENY